MFNNINLVFLFLVFFPFRAWGHGLFSGIQKTYTFQSALQNPAMLFFVPFAVIAIGVLYYLIVKKRKIAYKMDTHTQLSESKRNFILSLPIVYLFVVAAFHFDGWYHIIVGRDEFWIAPHFFVVVGQLVHLLLAFLLIYISRREKSDTHVLYTYLFWQVVFFVGLGFDEAWHRIIGQETIDTPLVFWGPPHFVIAASLLVSPFILCKIAHVLEHSVERMSVHILAFGTLFAFLHFYFQPLWPLGPFHVLGSGGEIIMLALLGCVMGWAVKCVPQKRAFFVVTLLTLIALSLVEIMTLGPLTSQPLISPVTGLPAYPYWLLFFSFLIPAIVLDGMRIFCLGHPVLQGAIWGGIHSFLYYVGAKLWVDLSPYSIFSGWEFYHGILLSWNDIVQLTLGGILGALIGFLIVEMFYQRE